MKASSLSIWSSKRKAIRYLDGLAELIVEGSRGFDLLKGDYITDGACCTFSAAYMGCGHSAEDLREMLLSHDDEAFYTIIEEIDKNVKSKFPENLIESIIGTDFLLIEGYLFNYNDTGIPQTWEDILKEIYRLKVKVQMMD